MPDTTPFPVRFLAILDQVVQSLEGDPAGARSLPELREELSELLDEGARLLPRGNPLHPGVVAHAVALTAVPFLGVVSQIGEGQGRARLLHVSLKPALRADCHHLQIEIKQLVCTARDYARTWQHQLENGRAA